MDRYVYIEIEKNGGKHINLPIHKKRISSLLLSSKLKDIYEKEKPDVVHVRSRMPAWINFLAFKKLHQKPLLVSTFHGLYSTPIYSQVMSKVDHAISISKTVKSYIKSTYKMTDDQITIIPRGCDSLQFNQDEIESLWLENWYKEFPQTIGKKILTLPTRITKWKGVDSFIDLVEALDSNDMHALVVGPVSESKKRYYQTLLDKVNKKLLSDKITFTGSRKDIANIYKISDIVYNLSIQPEPFGRTTIEAISCGTPVAGWRHGGTQEILEDLFPQACSTTFPALLSSMTLFGRMPSKRECRSSAAASSVLAFFVSKAEVRSLVHVRLAAFDIASRISLLTPPSSPPKSASG